MKNNKIKKIESLENLINEVASLWLDEKINHKEFLIISETINDIIVSEKDRTDKMELLEWSDWFGAADKIVVKENFVRVFVDGVGIADMSLNNGEWCSVRIGDYTFNGSKLTREYYHEIKNKE